MRIIGGIVVTEIFRLKQVPRGARARPLYRRQAQPSSLAFFGLFLQQHKKLIQKLQWGVILAYLILVILPAFLPIPIRDATLLNNFVAFAQFCFWGIWWPFVIVSMLLTGRLWCGALCPEGALSEWASTHFGQEKTIPRWIKWRGWPSLAFILTTLYGQLVSVYDYAQAALLVLGGSTIAAIIIGFLYGKKGTRVWCRYLCPVNGVFNLLSRLAPISFKTNPFLWDAYQGSKPKAPQCAPMINIHQLNGISACHLCGRCAGFKDAVQLEWRPFNEEIVAYGAQKTSKWEKFLLLFGMIGVAIGAFSWTNSQLFIQYKQYLGTLLVNHDIFAPLNNNAPWWLLTHYPDLGDAFTWLDGFCILTYLLGSGIFFYAFISALLWAIAKLYKRPALQLHLAQGLIPLAATTLFLGLSATTLKLLGYAGITFAYTANLRLLLLGLGSLWSLVLGQQILNNYPQRLSLTLLSYALYSCSLIPIIIAWKLIF